MGLITALAKFFGGQPAEAHEVRVINRPEKPAGSAEKADGAAERSAVAAMRPEQPIRVEPTRPGEALAAVTPPKPDEQAIEAKRVAELRQQYEKVVSIIEKVDKHLDQQEERSRRLMEVMEKFPAEAIDKLEGLSRHQTQMNESISTMGETMRNSLEGVSNSFGELATSNERLGELLGAMKSRDEARDRRLQEHMEHTVRHNQSMQKWMVGMLVLGSLGVAAALVVAVYVVVGPGAEVVAGG